MICPSKHGKVQNLELTQPIYPKRIEWVLITISPNKYVNNMIKSDIFACVVNTLWSVAQRIAGPREALRGNSKKKKEKEIRQ